MFKPILLIAVVVSLGMAGSASGPTPAQAARASAGSRAGSGAGSGNFAQLPADVQARAKTIYRIDCALCHGEDGNGQTDVAKSMNLTLQNWTDGKVLAAKSDQELFSEIRKGKTPMPPEPEDRATDAQVRALVLYIRSMAKTHPDAAPAATPAAGSAAGQAASGPSSMHP
ncbi:MAG TPA: cytochrome c [Terracidiphilus sp.]|nr:cytochrome c [Terracidiphilus sp.]